MVMRANPGLKALDARSKEVREWLEWAGARLLAMHIPSPAPRGPHVSWPEYADDHRQAYGYTGERLRAPQPRSNEIALMDEILLLPNLIPDITTRRIVNARALVTPVSNRYVYSWTKLAFMLHMDKRRVGTMHYKGILAIVSRLSPEKIDAIRRSMQSLST